MGVFSIFEQRTHVWLFKIVNKAEDIIPVLLLLGKLSSSCTPV